jgi:hypothetical protein
MSKKDKLPELLFVSPVGNNKLKERYKLTILRILEVDKDGVPKLLSLVREDDTVHLQKGDSFMTAYVPARMVRTDKEGAT